MLRSRLGGFSLVELVIVMVIVAIVAATVALRLSAQTNSAVVGDADQLRRNLSHVQALALGWGARSRAATAADGRSYSVTCRTALGRDPCNAVGDSVTDPATGTAFSVTLSSGVTLAPVSNTLDFDSLGRPVGTTGLLSSTPVVTYTLTGGSRTVTITVAPITGFALGSY